MMPHSLSRRTWLATTSLGTAATLLGRAIPDRGSMAAIDASQSLTIGKRLEPMVDDFLIASAEGGEWIVHPPRPQEVSLTCNAPWEGNTSAYYMLFQDEDRYRMYYRGGHFDETTRKATHPEVTCYAESQDGITWHKPELGLFDFNGSRQNNIVWQEEGAHNFAPFKDANPNAKPEHRYKALARGTTTIGGKSKGCLHAFGSPDGLRWQRIGDAVITEGAFDSQNLAFWDGERQEYRAYWRIFTNRIRAIRTATSSDFLRWENQADLTYEDSPDEHLYTNAIQPYFRAPHLFVGFPTRFQPKTEQVEPVFMSSRDGVHFRRSKNELIPITAPKDREGNRSNYMTCGLLALPGNNRELSVYATEAYYAGPASRVRRFTFRTDGFVSLSGPEKASIITKPLVFDGSQLTLNIFSRGPSKIEVLAADGSPIEGFKLNDCEPIAGDSIALGVRWKGNRSMAPLAGQPIKLRIELRQADLYALQWI